MNTIKHLIELIGNSKSCELSPPIGYPILPVNLLLPPDLKDFYQLAGGAKLHVDADYSINICSPNELERANPIIIGDECKDDISWDWFVIAKSGEQYITIDLNQDRLGLCYDSFWDQHGVAGSCPVIAKSFSELLQALFEADGNELYWLNKSFALLGDAYDGS